MKITTKYDFGDIVYLVTDSEQLERMITGFFIRPNTILYELSCGPITTSHYAIEISTEKNTITMFTN